MAASTSLQVDAITQGDLDTLEFMKQLRDCLIEQYATILIAVSDSQDDTQKKHFEAHLMNICDFVEQTLQIDGFNN